MKIQELATQIMRRAEEASELGVKLHAEVFFRPCGSRRSGYVVMIGQAEDCSVVGSFRDEAEAREFADEVNKALGPIIERRCISVLRACLDEMALGLDAIEQD